ncbi:retinoblastoma-like protein 1 isoform X1 [Bufo gargarizans]|uniref:retinoblastoma-like protein 1 isoform X1 n=1 Tax=Bufo gargarizans TaxID=30331 RepID=UPI001CF452E9|nr:retinoblastoma-like protein 1 isoform X1 [Bufo gargarizans]
MQKDDPESSSSSDGGPGELVREQLESLCRELNLDEETAAETMSNFTKTWSTYSLEGDVKHWLACALYAACRKGFIPTVGRGVMEGNGVSLTRILRSAKLSLIQFFNKMKKWMDMSNLPQEFRERVERLERNFEVSTVIFKKFKPIFMDIFQNPHEELPRLPRSRKQRKLQCNVKDLCNFCWTLFVYTKGNFSLIGDDLVNSYHLLLCCLDLVYSHTLQCHHKDDLLNPSFTAELSASEDDKDPPCLISTLCDHYDGLTVEAKGIKQHYFKPYISKLYDRKVIRGACLLDLSSFTDNNKALNKEYEEYVLTVGDFDERVFLGDDADEEIGTPRKFLTELPMGSCTPRKNLESSLQQHFEKRRSFAPSTPLTGRRYLKEKEAVITPVSSATQCVSKLQSMVTGLRNTPSEQLINIFRSCARNPMENIQNTVNDVQKLFCHHYTQPSEDQPGSHIDFAVNRWKLAEILYYKVLESIVFQEIRRLNGKDLTALLEQDIFHQSLLACCLEIVLFAYSSPRKFPWTIEVLNLSPFNFYKVIEVFIRSEDGLSRDMVKHLNSIEEQILEERAWTNNSVLWELLRASDTVPTCEEVIIPSNFETGNEAGLGHLPMMPASPIIHPRLKEVRTDFGGSGRRDTQPLSPLSVHERYNSPTAGSAKRRLFGDDGPKESPVERLHTTPENTRIRIVPFQPSEQMCVSPDKTQLFCQRVNVTGYQNESSHQPSQPQCENGIQVPLTAQALISPKSQLFRTQDVCPTSNKPKRTGSLALFFRKVYHLASVRLRDLCLKLDLPNDLRRKIWTLFEYSLVHCTDLMKDRHIDQLLLCAVYIMAKSDGSTNVEDAMKSFKSFFHWRGFIEDNEIEGVTKEERLFHDIMKCYRNQPQAESRVYRHVLVKKLPDVQQSDAGFSQDVEMADCDSNDSLSDSKQAARASDQDRGDLITFYNNVYVERVQLFALKYAVSTSDHLASAPPLSPFPSIRQQAVSPRRVSQQHSIYVSPHKNTSCLTPRSSLLYKFNGSPSKSLEDINSMIKQDHRSRKRAITIDSDSDSPAKRMCTENEDVLLKRLQDVVSERAIR